MSKILWLLGGTTLALAVFAILNADETVDGFDQATGKLGDWGLKQRVAGAGGGVLGKVTEFAGNVTGDRETSAQGIAQQATGTLRNAAGQAAEALSNTLHDLHKA